MTIGLQNGRTLTAQLFIDKTFYVFDSESKLIVSLRSFATIRSFLPSRKRDVRQPKAFVFCFIPFWMFPMKKCCAHLVNLRLPISILPPNSPKYKNNFHFVFI